MTHKEYERYLMEGLRAKLPPQDEANVEKWVLPSPKQIEADREALAKLLREMSKKVSKAHDPLYFRDGKFKFNTHGRKDTGDQPIVEDMACDELRSEWKDYRVLPDGREGPVIRNSDEMREAMKLSGQRFREPGEKYDNPLERGRQRLERRARELGLDPKREREMTRAQSYEVDQKR